MQMRKKLTAFTDTVRAAIIRNPGKSNGYFSREFLILVETVRRIRHDLRDKGLVPQREA